MGGFRERTWVHVSDERVGFEQNDERDFNHEILLFQSESCVVLYRNEHSFDVSL